MSQVRVDSDDSVSRRLADYQAEINRKRLRTTVSFLIVLAVTALFIVVITGDRFERTLAFFGLQSAASERGGVFTDCSGASAKNSPYCQANSSNADKDWEKINKSGGTAAPFTLYNLGK